MAMTMRRLQSKSNLVLMGFVLAAAVTLPIVTSANRQPIMNATTFGSESTGWVLPVVVKAGSPDDFVEAAGELQDFLSNGRSQFVNVAETNPACCFWIEQSGSSSGYRGVGYFMEITPNASRLWASDVTQLRDAIVALKRAAQSDGGIVRLPVGIMARVLPRHSAAPRG